MSFGDRSQHTRVNPMLLGPLERPALRWLAAHMPAWVHPDLLTAFGFFGTVVIFVSYILTNHSPWFLWLASLGLIMKHMDDTDYDVKLRAILTLNRMDSNLLKLLGNMLEAKDEENERKL